MQDEVSKSEFKARALEILRAVEDTGEPILVTDRGVPTIEVRPYNAQIRNAKQLLRGSVLVYENPEAPTDEHWEALD